MAKPVVLMLDDGPWQLITWDNHDELCLHDVPRKPDETPDQRITGMREQLDLLGATGTSILLAVPSTWCAAATVTTDNLPRQNRATALAYRLEEMLPVAAEQFSAGFISNNTEALGVCVLLDKIKPIIDGIESQGTFVHSVIPTTFLLAQDYADTIHDTSANVLLWRHDGWCDAIVLSEQRKEPTSWSLLPDDSQAVSLQINLLPVQGTPVRGVAIACDTEDRNCNERPVLDGDPTTTYIKEDPYTLAARCAKRILTGQIQPWTDLKGENLGASNTTRLLGKPLLAVISAAALMLMCFNIGLIWRAAQYQNLSDYYQNQERAVYTDLYPGAAPPLAINTRLAGEFHKIQGTRGRSDSLPPPPRTLMLLREILEQLPDQTRFRVMELRIEEDTAYLDGQARSHGDVGTITQALGHNGALLAETRHTELLMNDEQGVSFILVAKPRVDTK